MSKLTIVIMAIVIAYSGINSLYAQLNLKRDDFIGTSIRNWWDIRQDGTSTPAPEYRNGYISFRLISPREEDTPWSDCEIYDGYPNPGGPWNNVTVTLRARMLNSHRDGSHGWGLWYAEWDPIIEQNQAFFMRCRDKDDSSAANFQDKEWFRADNSNGKCESNHYFTELYHATPEPEDIDETEWHTYTITIDVDGEGTRYIEMLVDGDQVLYNDDPNTVPDQNFGFHIWIDNFIYDPQDNEPDCDIYFYRRGWSGESEMVLDYVQIMPANQTLDSYEMPSGIKRLRKIPNEIFNGPTKSLWKQYEFDSPAGGAYVFLFTGRVEEYLHSTYMTISDADDFRYEIDGTDYGWGAHQSSPWVYGSGTVIVYQNITEGNEKVLNLFGDITPLLYDVTVLGSGGGGIVVDNEYNETKDSQSDELWKTIDFQTWGGEVAIYVSGSADEDPNPSPVSHYGYDISEFNDDDDDDMKIMLDDTDYEYHNNNAFWGNGDKSVRGQFGEPKSVLIIANLTQGSHTLRIYGQGTPTLHRILIYGENDDSSLSITLTSFEVTNRYKSNLIEWQTESEIENLGFNIYRAQNEVIIPQNQLEFTEINKELIPGAGNSADKNYYYFEDFDIKKAHYYWYQLEDISYNGSSIKHDVKMVYTDTDIAKGFLLMDNYPNPFNIETRIPINLQKDTDVELSIYDTSGRLIDVMLNDQMSAGYHELIWSGKKYVSGVYYYRLSTSSGNQSKKLLLLK